jgi:hypothetical protein
MSRTFNRAFNVCNQFCHKRRAILEEPARTPQSRPDYRVVAVILADNAGTALMMYARCATAYCRCRAYIPARQIRRRQMQRKGTIPNLFAL